MSIASAAVAFVALSHALPNHATPIQTRNHRAVALAFLRMPFASEPLGKGSRSWEIGLTAANDLRSLPGLYEDAEVERLDITYKMGLSENRDVWVNLPLMSRGGGFLDPLIDSWHRLILGWTDPARDSLPHGASQVGEPSFGSAAGQGDLTVGMSQKLSGNWSASVALKLPTGDASKLMGSGAPDLGVSADYRKQFARHLTLHAQIGLIAQGKATKLDSSRGLVDQEAFALIYTPNSRDAWIAQWQSERAAISTGVSGADATHRLVTFGYRRKLSSRDMLELYFSEDRDLFNRAFPEGANVGPDFTCGLRYGWRF